MSSYHPVVIFTYKRLTETKNTIKSLLQNPEIFDSNVIIYVDGPKDSHDLLQVSEVVNYVRSIDCFKSLKIIERHQNLGLANSFITGIGEVLSEYNAAIFLEDDNLLSPDFLRYMNEALDYYSDNEDVFEITGYSFPLIPQTKDPYFIRGAGTWSFATWARSWDLFESSADICLEKIQRLKLEKEMRMYGIDFHEMLQKQVRGEIDSWGVRWWATAVINNKLTLYPGLPLCINVGGGIGGTHTLSKDPLLNAQASMPNTYLFKLPDKIEISRFLVFRFRLMHFKHKIQRNLGRLVSHFNGLGA